MNKCQENHLLLKKRMVFSHKLNVFAHYQALSESNNKCKIQSTFVEDIVYLLGCITTYLFMYKLNIGTRISYY